MNKSFTIKSCSVSISLELYPLVLRAAFGTAHSLTTERKDALFTLKINDIVGYGEVGLPPKKPFCYKADYNDIEQYCKYYAAKVEEVFSSVKDFPTYDPFRQLPTKYFAPLRPSSSDSDFVVSLQQLFCILDDPTMEGNLHDYASTGKCLIEMALLDAYGKYLKKPLHELITPTRLPVSRSFYTVGLTPTLPPMLESADFGIKYTSLLKIKLDADVKRGAEITEQLDSHLTKRGTPMKQFSIDANSSWTPASSLEFLGHINQDLTKKFCMLEQPFPADFLKVKPATPEEDKEWKAVKEKYGKVSIPVVADESICSAADVIAMKDYVHGVNVKMEKAGGIRGALLAADKAHELGLQVWIGVMVASSLNSNAAAHLLCTVADLGSDLDGGLLVDDKSQLFEGGFVWNGDGTITLSDAWGVGVTKK
eukprot:Phypoly_transcript_09273.p1 GENE.Phypoly_transcript_09273~~Phypoly_transcript_09273.p1  ORF type:complete len:423 (+),score=78.39 Phypoly_transcript_09273:66-1334(+)